jgi:hypothetical protein
MGTIWDPRDGGTSAIESHYHKTSEVRATRADFHVCSNAIVFKLIYAKPSYRVHEIEKKIIIL